MWRWQVLSGMEIIMWLTKLQCDWKCYNVVNVIMWLMRPIAIAVKQVELLVENTTSLQIIDLLHYITLLINTSNTSITSICSYFHPSTTNFSRPIFQLWRVCPWWSFVLRSTGFPLMWSFLMQPVKLLLMPVNFFKTFSSVIPPTYISLQEFMWKNWPWCNCKNCYCCDE